MKKQDERKPQPLYNYKSIQVALHYREMGLWFWKAEAGGTYSKEDRISTVMIEYEAMVLEYEESEALTNQPNYYQPHM